jgi:hypothetical protein
MTCRNSAQEGTEAEGAPDVVEQDIALDDVVESQRAAVQECKVGRRLTKSRAHLVDDEVAPARLPAADVLLARVHGERGRANARLEERKLLEQATLPLVGEHLVFGVEGN